MLKVRESVDVIQGFGCRYRRTTRRFMLFGVLPLFTITATRRI